ncbi:hypothetical protein, partial [Rhodospirillum rubrum]|uniref:hypothetical protein n=1 Tax=Rhodospirillum rubrum TaxID=1085 RepID=UPI001A91F572
RVSRPFNRPTNRKAPPMRFMIRFILLAVVLGVIALGVTLAGLDGAPPRQTVEKVIPNDRF